MRAGGVPLDIFTDEITLSTKGNGDVLNITEAVESVIKDSKIAEGLVNVSVVGSTAAITTIEFEPALVKDLQEVLEKLVPSGKEYHHDKTWGDANGFSHIRSALIGTSRAFSLKGGELMLGTWQQIILADFDNRKRTRKVIVQVVGK
ncbi:MAG: secondary thiamine-phosphate synthase enzyme YjbQ [Elusimicrobia bacterium]|nr:secondary thiamine-phosphate synthase enzyme YjbQ [Candidatus Liberimonas magnetica]